MDQDLLYRRRYYFTPPNADNASTPVSPFALWSAAVCNRYLHVRGSRRDVLEIRRCPPRIERLAVIGKYCCSCGI